MSRKNKTYFFDAPDNGDGKKFSRYNHPTKEIFQELFNSLPFIADSEDTAKENEAGHVKMATDAESIARTITTDKHSKAVRPYQLPMLISGDNEVLLAALTNAGIKVTPVEKTFEGGKKRLSYKVEVAPVHSIAIDGATEGVMLSGDIKVALDETHEEKYYGIRGGVRGFYNVIPEYSVGALRCRLIPASGGDPAYYELYWDTSSTGSTEIYSRKLNGSYTSVNYSGPTGKQVLKSYNVAAGYMQIGATIKIRGVFEIAANLGRSKVGCYIGLTNGDYAPVPLILRQDGNASGMIEFEGQVTLLSDDDVPEFMIYNGKSYNAGLPSEVIVHNFKTNWSFSPATAPLRIELTGERSNESGSITCHSLEVEFIK